MLILLVILVSTKILKKNVFNVVKFWMLERALHFVETHKKPAAFIISLISAGHVAALVNLTF